ncbi:MULTISPECIES: hypothetical protein [Chelativorans]|jgi:hypothetical protein|uniref:Uncharacterized protein n=1 Tax=Chelativorans sp. (strain BNC1) TaxID=266779 RepID=Q11J02_CHESB|nr:MULTISPECIES: hypothetical protein [Chelativorans]
MKLVYSGTRVPGLKKADDITIVNPVHFTGVKKEAKTVYLNGDYPNIKAAYEDVGVKVHSVSDLLPKAKQEG